MLQTFPQASALLEVEVLVTVWVEVCLACSHCRSVQVSAEGLGVALADLAAQWASAGSEERADPVDVVGSCLLYTSPSPRDGLLSRMPSSA